MGPVIAAMLGGLIIGVLLTRLFDSFDGGE